MLCRPLFTSSRMFCYGAIMMSLLRSFITFGNRMKSQAGLYGSWGSATIFSWDTPSPTKRCEPFRCHCRDSSCWWSPVKLMPLFLNRSSTTTEKVAFTGLPGATNSLWITSFMTILTHRASVFHCSQGSNRSARGDNHCSSKLTPQKTFFSIAFPESFTF